MKNGKKARAKNDANVRHFERLDSALSRGKNFELKKSDVVLFTICVFSTKKKSVVKMHS